LEFPILPIRIEFINAREADRFLSTSWEFVAFDRSIVVSSGEREARDFSSSDVARRDRRARKLRKAEATAPRVSREGTKISGIKSRDRPVRGRASARLNAIIERGDVAGNTDENN